MGVPEEIPGNHGEYSVLAVDDDADFLSLVKQQLKAEFEEISVWTATSVRKGEIRLGEEDVDCVISDYEMQDETGLEFLASVREDEPELPFILFTGQGSESLASEAISAGVTDYVQKTADDRFSILSELIRAAVENYHAKQAQAQLAETAAVLSAVLNNTPHPIYTLDTDGTILDANEAALKATQYTETNLSGKPLETVIEPASATTFDTALPIDSSTTFEAAHVHRRGGETPVNVTIESINTTSEVEAIAVVEDISDQKHEEATIRELNQTGLRLMDARAKPDIAETIVDTAQDTLSLPLVGIWLTNTEDSDDLSVLEFHDPTNTVYTPQSKNLSTPDAKVETVLKTGESVIFGKTNTVASRFEDAKIDGRMLLPLGDHGVLEIPVQDKRLYDDRDFRMVELLATSAERALNQTQREHQLRRKQNELAAQNERLEKFSSMVSHDLKNPLSIASGHFDLIKQGISEAEINEESVTAVDDALTRMEELIDDLLTLARQGETAMDVESVSLPSVVEESWEVVESEQASLSLNADFSIRGDRGQLQHVFENLLSNAVTHGGEDVSITVGGLDDREGFYVADDGRGIPPDEREQVFEDGFTTAENGTGFGLMIVEDIVQQHGWEISVGESCAGGARFEIVTA
jgi:PAS domain S-box-containing protein